MMKILFVDDERRILHGLRRLLRPLRREWSMTFVDSGQAALDHLEVERAHALITDLRMPGIDGLELLKRVTAEYPDIVRIVLSGQPEMEHFLRTVGPAHQYLAKPCDPDRLRSAVRRSAAVQQVLAEGSLRQIVAGMGSLPSRSDAVQELISELMSPDASVQTVAAIVARDLAMTVKVMQVVNSAFFGLPKQVSDASQAVKLLGIDAVRSLVLSLQVFSAFAGPGSRCVSPDALWNHSSGVGSMARRIAVAERMSTVDTGHALLAGLLHDLGKLILADQFPDEYGAVLDKAKKERQPSFQAELERFGATHAQVGGYLAALWGFPFPVVEALVYHHCPSDGPSDDLDITVLVHVADAFDYDQEGQAARLDTAGLEAFGLIDQLDGWRELCVEGEGD